MTNFIDYSAMCGYGSRINAVQKADPDVREKVMHKIGYPLFDLVRRITPDIKHAFHLELRMHGLTNTSNSGNMLYDQ